MRLLLIAILALTLPVCSDNEFGNGIGRPRFSKVVHPARRPLVISQVFAATNDLSQHFIQLGVPAEAAVSVDLSDLKLCGATSCEPLSGSIAVGEFGVFSAANFGLSASAGEIAVVDAEESVQAYLAWGSDPAVWNSPYSAKALLAGAYKINGFIPLPFPMPEGLAVASVQETRGCAAPNREGQAEIDSSLCPKTPAPVVITEVLPNVSGDLASWVEIKNVTGNELNLDGVRLCQPPFCAVFKGVQLSAQAYLLVFWGAAEPSDPSLADPNHVFFADLPTIDPEGELILLAPGASDVLADPDSVLAFLRYHQGLNPPGASLFSSAATLAGAWPSATKVALSPRIAGEALSLNGSLNWDGTDWLADPPWNPVGAPSPLAQNLEISASANLWTSCSYPRPWDPKEKPPVMVARVSAAIPATILLHNFSSQDQLLNKYTLNIGQVALTLQDYLPSDSFLAVDGELLIELDPDSDGCAENTLCYADPQALLPQEGELALLLDGALGQYIAWGALETTRLLADQAVTANIWPQVSCLLPKLETGVIFELKAQRTGQSPPDYSY